MSLNDLILDQPKKYLNARINNLKVDGTLDFSKSNRISVVLPILYDVADPADTNIVKQLVNNEPVTPINAVISKSGNIVSMELKPFVIPLVNQTNGGKGFVQIGLSLLDPTFIPPLGSSWVIGFSDGANVAKFCFAKLGANSVLEISDGPLGDTFTSVGPVNFGSKGLSINLTWTT